MVGGGVNDAPAIKIAKALRQENQINFVRVLIRLTKNRLYCFVKFCF